MTAALAPRLALSGNKLLVDAGDRQPVFDPRLPDETGAPTIALEGWDAAVVQPAAPPDEAAAAYSALLGRPVRFVDPMFELGRYEPRVRGAVVRALAVAKWSADYRFCPNCGKPLHWDVPGHSKACENEPPHRIFPRLDPATIMLVSDGERALLGRQPTWPPGMYSTLAGFVDRGESVEEAVAREVREEAGVEVTDVRYFGSEPWPFPRSLMLGFTARATTSEIVRGEELDDVRWFTLAETRELVRLLDARAPYADTIARRLIRAWVAERTLDGTR